MQFEQLDVWKRSVNLSVEVYKGFASAKDYGFKDQITRSALSIASNIAEGMERATNKDCCKFLNYAKGPAGELVTQIIIGTKINYIEKQKGKAWVIETKEIAAMIGGLIKARS